MRSMVSYNEGRDGAGDEGSGSDFAGHRTSLFANQVNDLVAELVYRLLRPIVLDQHESAFRKNSRACSTFL